MDNAITQPHYVGIPRPLALYGLLIFSVAIPTSTFLTTFSMAVFALYYLFTGHWSEKRPDSAPVVFLGAGALVGVWLIGTLYTPVPFKEAFAEDHQLLRLFYLPILVWMARGARTQYLVICAFVGVMALSAILGFFQRFELLPIPLYYTPGAVFKNHIATSFFVSIATYLSLYHYLFVPRHRKLALSLTALFIFYSLFVCMGRTGLITSITLGLLLAWQYNRVKGILAALCIISLLGGLSFLTSDVMQKRWQFLHQNAQQYKEQDISVALRLEFAEKSWKIFQQKPILGYGTGSFGGVYAKNSTSDQTLTVDPHQEFLRWMVEHGLLGLCSLILFFILQWFYPHPEKKNLCHALAVVFAVGCMGNSLLMNFSESHFWLLALALCYAPTERQPT